jgi:peptide/nickel transport system substrate-binding protein
MGPRGHWKAMAGAAAAGSALMAVGLSGSPAVTSAAAASTHASQGSLVTYAEYAGTSPDYIFPETTSANQSLYNNSQFLNLLYPYVYLPDPYQPVMDYNRSMAYKPVFSDNDTVVTVKLKHWKWSDGVPVTARDLIFYINLGKAEGTTWGNYAGPTQFPYNLKSYTAVNSTTARFVLKVKMNPTYFIDNGLDYITPIPQHAWDKTSANGPVGNYDTTPSGAKKVAAFLQKEAADTNSYATNPLWKVVDGPYMLKSYGGSSSPDVFVANPRYSGTRPAISTFEEVPFTSDSAEFTALVSGKVDYGYVPTPDVPVIPRIKSEGYNITPTPTWGFDYIIPNQKNPQVGPILGQAYIRAVLAHLIDQGTMIAHFMQGYGVPTYGPTPIYPKGNPFLSPSESHNPYPYSVKDAEKLLKDHGWKVNPKGTDVCQVPGPKGCGAGVTKGEKLSLNLLYSSGEAILQEDTDLFQSDAAQAGVQINPRSETFNTVISQVQPCVLPKDKGTPTCNWQLGEYGGISLSTYPSGEGLLNTGGAFNAGQFSDATLDKLIQQSTTSTDLSVYKRYEDRVVGEEPWIWQPVPDRIFATKKGLSGYGLTSEFDGGFGYLEPEFWTFNG